jgi:hypothetical protein
VDACRVRCAHVSTSVRRAHSAPYEGGPSKDSSLTSPQQCRCSHFKESVMKRTTGKLLVVMALLGTFGFGLKPAVSLAAPAPEAKILRWPTGEIVIQSLDASRVVVALDRTGDGVSERLLLLTTDQQLDKPLSVSGRGRIYVRGDRLFLISENLEDIQLHLVQVAEYRGPAAMVRLEALHTGEAAIEKGILEGGPVPFGTGGGAGGCTAASGNQCSTTCSDGSSCSVTCGLSTQCAVCECPTSCSCKPRS